jgi:hypothetical protein
MRILTTLCIAILFACSTPFSTTTADKKISVQFQSIDNIKSLARLFTNGRVKCNHIVWPMDYEDYKDFQYIVSKDSLCHTTIDNILVQDTTYYVLFRTDYYEGKERASCHMCTPITSIASFYKTKDGYVLKHFKKRVFQLGGFGGYGSIRIDSLCKPVLHVSSGYATSGYVMDYEFYYDLDDFSYLYNFTSYSSNPGIFAEDEPGFTSTKKEIIDRTYNSFVILTTDIKVDSVAVRKQTQSKELVTFYDEEGRLLIKTMKLEE